MMNEPNLTTLILILFTSYINVISNYDKNFQSRCNVAPVSVT